MPAKTMPKRSAHRRAQPETLPATRRGCHHYWVIDPPNGPTSTGHCKNCGQRRRFPNSSEDSIWDGAEGRSRWNDMGLSRSKRRSALEEPVVEENVVTV